MTGENPKKVEVRGFSLIKELFGRRNVTFPVFLDLAGECTAADLAGRLEIPADMIECAFINGVACGLEERVRPGDRVAFVPPGTPGPYRLTLGFVRAAREGKTK